MNLVANTTSGGPLKKIRPQTFRGQSIAGLLNPIKKTIIALKRLEIHGNSVTPTVI